MATRTADLDTGAAQATVLHQPEELDSGLVPHLSEVETLGLVLKAPLVFMVPYLPALAATANRAYRMKREAVAQAETDGDWQKVLWLHEKPYRMSVFLRVRERMSDRDYWQALSDMWLETENLHEHRDEWVAALTASRPGRAHWLMDESERTVLAGLDEQVTVYRGFRRTGRHLAPSWTLDRTRAEWFARRPLDPPSGDGYLATATVPKTSVIAYFAGRGEQEIVLNPDELPDPQITTVTGGPLL
ncbi:MAG: hypothetical protein ACRDLF_00655 [Solirubrobacteraceae bacterium]